MAAAAAATAAPRIYVTLHHDTPTTRHATQQRAKVQGLGWWDLVGKEGKKEMGGGGFSRYFIGFWAHFLPGEGEQDDFCTILYCTHIRDTFHMSLVGVHQKKFDGPTTRQIDNPNIR